MWWPSISGRRWDMKAVATRKTLTAFGPGLLNNPTFRHLGLDQGLIQIKHTGAWYSVPVPMFDEPAQHTHSLPAHAPFPIMFLGL